MSLRSFTCRNNHSRQLHNLHANVFVFTGETGVPTATKWMTDTLTSGEVVGASPFLVGSGKSVGIKVNLSPPTETGEKVQDICQQ